MVAAIAHVPVRSSAATKSVVAAASQSSRLAAPTDKHGVIDHERQQRSPPGIDDDRSPATSPRVNSPCVTAGFDDEDGEVDLRLRPLRVDDEAAYRAAQAELLADGFSFGFIQDAESFTEHVQRLERQRRGRDLGDLVESTWLVAEVAGQLVGRASIRHQLNEYLAFHGGHIGYGVRPAFRRRGYATEILRQSLIIARSYGIGPVLVTCDDDNIASAAVIEACGGQLERVVPGHESDDGVPFRRYWIP